MRYKDWKTYLDEMNEKIEKDFITHKEIAVKIDCKPSHISRMLRKEHKPSIDLFLKVADAINYKITFNTKTK